MLRLVPDALREASYALGVPRWKTIVRIVIPTALPGIVTGVMLGVARVAGETAPVLLVTFGTNSINTDPFSGPQSSLPLFVYQQAGLPNQVAIDRASSPTSGAPGWGAEGFAMAKRIEIESLSCFYGNFKAVEDVTLSVEPKSVTAFIGPSGCGKSTVLRALNRMHEVTPGAHVTGRVLLDQDDIYGPGVDPVQVRRTIGMVFQRPNPFPTMSVLDNVVAGLRLNGMKKKSTLEEEAERSLRGAGLWDEVKDRLHRPGAGLSGGQQQRVCIARAIAVQPQVLLMDEPCSALDPISTLAIEDLIAQLRDQYTIVIVTHNMQQASRVSERTGFFNISGVGQPGKLIEMDSTHKIFSNPTEKRTEDYVTGRFG